MKTKNGDTVKSFLNGNYHKVERIVKSMAVPESENGQRQILAEFKTWRLL